MKIGIAIGLVALSLWQPVRVRAQEATPTPEGPRVEVLDGEGVNVRAGPSQVFDPPVGRLVPGQSAQILGKVNSAQYVWLKIVYFGGPDNIGWVAALPGAVQITGDLESVPVVSEVPPTPTVPATPTIPFGQITITPANANRLPTFTPPAIIPRPTLLPEQGIAPNGGAFPPALAILGLFVLGVLLAGVSVVRGRG